jgi:hypothetical protein
MGGANSFAHTGKILIENPSRKPPPEEKNPGLLGKGAVPDT